MAILKYANLALTFLLELCLLAGFGVWGFATGSGLPMQIVLGIGAPLLAAVFWGLFMAPKAVRPLRFPVHQIVEVAIFALACAALYAVGQPTLAAIFALVFALNFVLRLVWRD